MRQHLSDKALKADSKESGVGRKAVAKLIAVLVMAER